MSIVHGDHLVVMRNGRVLLPTEQEYLEYVVVTDSPQMRDRLGAEENHPDAIAQKYHDVTLQVVSDRVVSA